MPMTERIYEAQQRAFSLLEKKGLDPGAARILMEYVTGKAGALLLADMREWLTEEEHRCFWDKVTELQNGKPVQYVIGTESFYGRSFVVDEHVLIPRPETEELVHGALERCRRIFGDQAEISVADIGTGSGAIAVTFKKEWPNAEITATDISPEALRVAESNAERHGAAIKFAEGDLTEPVSGTTWDVVLSNPPYIGREEATSMSGTVLDFEPHQALFAEEEGLYCYRKLAENLPQLMNKPALIGVEIGYAQGAAVHKLLADAFPQASIEIVEDINGKDRILFCEIRE